MIIIIIIIMDFNMKMTYMEMVLIKYINKILYTNIYT